MMSQTEINNSIKRIWSERLKNKKEGLTESILNGYANWVRNLVKQTAEQQAQQTQKAQSGAPQIGAEQQGGAA